MLDRAGFVKWLLQSLGPKIRIRLEVDLVPKEKKDSTNDTAVQPRTTDELLQLLELMAKLQEQRYVVTSYPSTNTIAIN